MNTIDDCFLCTICNFNDNLLTFIFRCCHLQSINLHACSDVTDVGIAAVASNCSKLQSIILYACNITDESVRSLVLKCSNLQSICLSAWYISKISKNVLQQMRTTGVVVHCMH
jgi:hypothetical protein